VSARRDAPVQLNVAAFLPTHAGTSSSLIEASDRKALSSILSGTGQFCQNLRVKKTVLAQAANVWEQRAEMKEDAFGDAVAKVIQEKDPAMRAQVMVEMLENVDLNKCNLSMRHCVELLPWLCELLSLSDADSVTGTTTKHKLAALSAACTLHGMFGSVIRQLSLVGGANGSARNVAFFERQERAQKALQAFRSLNQQVRPLRSFDGIIGYKARQLCEDLVHLR